MAFSMNKNMQHGLGHAAGLAIEVLSNVVHDTFLYFYSHSRTQVAIEGRPDLLLHVYL
jgi:hypothetical protein